MRRGEQATKGKWCLLAHSSLKGNKARWRGELPALGAVLSSQDECITEDDFKKRTCSIAAKKISGSQRSNNSLMSSVKSVWPVQEHTGTGVDTRQMDMLSWLQTQVLNSAALNNVRFCARWAMVNGAWTVWI